MKQKIKILNKRGENLVGVLHETGSTKIVVLCHGARSSKEDNIMVNLAVALENEGISAFRFDFSGNGESEGSFQSGNLSSEVEDLRAVVEYFIGVNRLTVAVLGHSKGGCIVLLYASQYHDIGAVVNVSGRYDLQRGFEERLGENFLERLKKDGYIDVKTRAGSRACRKGLVDYRVTEESVMEALNTNMHDACLLIDERCRFHITLDDLCSLEYNLAYVNHQVKKAVASVHGSLDEINPVQDALEFAKIIPNHQLQIIEGADHLYSSHQHELASVVLRFIKECLQDGNDVSK
ncbi:hypothetical protein DH2020_018613 [Rehmannia glutinosa]|uniref:Serine aminopeptidase S33 domain-containing protein n=1 Tax=Rehmannia glutinosa TaxID=99300 RepID=A0ABR0WLE2_REHGL